MGPEGSFNMIKSLFVLRIIKRVVRNIYFWLTRVTVLVQLVATSQDKRQKAKNAYIK